MKMSHLIGLVFGPDKHKRERVAHEISQQENIRNHDIQLFESGTRRVAKSSDRLIETMNEAMSMMGGRSGKDNE
jgi:hypothetical protein